MHTTGDRRKAPLPSPGRRHRRRNPLRSRAHVAHDMFGALLVVVACGLPALGFLVGRTQTDAGMGQRQHVIQTNREVPAVLQQDVHHVGSASVWTPRKVAAAVTWTAADGTIRTAKAEVSSVGRLGEATTIWLDPAGNPTTQPPTRGAVLAEGVSLGVLAVLGGAGVLLVVYGAENTAFTHLRSAAWERDWARTAPSWGQAG